MRNLLLLPLLLLAVACDHGFAPPEAPQLGAISVDISYLDYENAWPAPDSLFDLRFVAMPFIPQDTSDILQLNLLVISDRLELRQKRQGDMITVTEVKSGTYVYSGVAEQFDRDVFSWRPVGLYEEDGGVFTVQPGETTSVAVTVDFKNRPPFPPP
jgi:hypothetical protein